MRGMDGTPDEDEYRLWKASQSYMGGELTVKQLEEIERPHAQNLRKAVVALARQRWRRRKMELAEDERERHLWMASRLYMAGELTGEQLEEIEHPHTRKLSKAIIALARWNVKWDFLDLLRINRKRSVDV